MKLLTLATQILAVDPVETATEFQTSDAIYPKHVIEGYALAEVEALPDDYAPGRYTFDGAFVRVPDPAPVVVVPDSVEMRQARLELLDAGLLDAVDSAVTAAGRSAKIEWEFALTVKRAHPLFPAIQQQTGLTDAQVDDLFVRAAAR